MKKRAIIFDFGKVIIDYDLTRFTKKISALCNETSYKIFDFVFEGTLNKSFDRGDLTPNEFFEKIATNFSLNITFDNFVPMWNDIFKPIPETEKILMELKKNYRLGLLSNTNALHFPYALNKYPAVTLLNDYHLSYKMRTIKPEEKIYKQVIDFYNCKPQELFYIDDLEWNVEAARKLGIESVVFITPEQLKIDLKKAAIL
ncbi:MAG: HAD family phosphatase [Endomicrobiales bacterium]|nr:HAD family phosphatase [Endomicrobiales bacterium]